MRHFWSPRPTQQQTDSDDTAHEIHQQSLNVPQSSDSATAAPSTLDSSDGQPSAAVVAEDADDPMEISFMQTPSSAGAMPITPFVSQPSIPHTARPSPVPFNLSRPSVGAAVTARRTVPPVPLFAASESNAPQPSVAAAVGPKSRVRGRFEAPDRDDEKEAADEQPTTQQPFTVRVEDEKQHTTLHYTTAAVAEEEKELPAQDTSGTAAAAEKDTKKRKRDSSDMVDIDDDIAHATQQQSPQPQPHPPQHSSASPASATSTDDDDMPHSIKKLRIADDPPPATLPPSSSSTAAPRNRDSLTSRINEFTIGWYSSLFNRRHGAPPTAETIMQAGMDNIGLKEEAAASEEGKEGRGGGRMDEIKRHRGDKREKQLKERQQEKSQRHEQGDEKGRAGVKQRVPNKHKPSHEHTEQPQHRPVELLHTDPPPPQQKHSQQHVSGEAEEESQSDGRGTGEEKEKSRAGPKAALKEAGEEARRKRMMAGAERRRQGREHTLLEKREMQRKREEEARKEAERKEEEQKEEMRRREDEQRRRQAELLEQARAIHQQRAEREEKERQKAAEAQREREQAEQREREAQRQREREREREKQDREQQQQQRQRAADKENIQTHNRPPTTATSTEETPRRSTRLSSLHQHTTKPATTAPPTDDSISARLHARRVEKEERDRSQQAERDERERLVPSIERSVRQRARGRDYVGLVREFAPQLLEGKGRVAGGEVRKVLRRCMALYHPDKWQTRSVRERVESEQVFAVIQRAYEECGS